MLFPKARCGAPRTCFSDSALTDPFTEDDAWDSGEEMDKYHNDQDGYDYMTTSDRAAAMQLRAQRSRRASEIEIKKATTREAVERMEEAVMHLECEGSLTHRRALAVDPVGAECPARALAQSDVSQFALVIGCERVVAIARRAGLPPSTPVVRSVVDPPSSSSSPARTLKGPSRSGIATWRRCYGNI